MNLCGVFQGAVGGRLKASGLLVIDQVKQTVTKVESRDRKNVHSWDKTKPSLSNGNMIVEGV